MNKFREVKTFFKEEVKYKRKKNSSKKEVKL